MGDATHQAGDQAALAHHVDHGIFLGDAQRIGYGHQIAQHADFDLFRALGEDGSDQIAIAHQPIGAEMMFVAARRIEAAFLGEDHAVDIGPVGIGRRHRIETPVAHGPVLVGLIQLIPGHEMEKNEFHGLPLLFF